MPKGPASIKAIVLWVFLASIALTVLAAITAVVFDDLALSDTVLFTSMLLAVHSLGSLLGAVLWQRKPTRRMVVIALSLGITGGLLWVALIWLDEFNVLQRSSSEELLAKCAATGTVSGLAFLVRGLLLWPKGNAVGIKALRLAGWICGFLAALILLGSLWTEEFSEVAGKLLGVLLILSTGSTIGTFIADRLSKGDLIEHEDSQLARAMPVTLTCPRCTHAVELRANTKGACPSCHLKLRVEFEEPRCTCGYLLHGLTGDVCPECGQAIQQEPPWKAESIAPTAAQSETAAPDRTPPT